MNDHSLFMDYYTQLKEISIYDSGKSAENWWELTYHFLEYLPAAKKIKSPYYEAMQKIQIPNYHKTKKKFQLLLNQMHWSFLRLQGRTILLKNDLGDILSIKVQKAKEPLEALFQEYRATKIMKERAIEFKLLGGFADAMGLIKLTRRALRKMIKLEHAEFTKSDFYSLTSFVSKDNYIVYVYKVSHMMPGYHTYLHDPQISQPDFSQSNKITVTNLSKLLSHGVIFDRLADIFHNVVDNLSANTNRPDLGRYIVLANLLAPTQFRAREKSGSGRLTAWRKAIQYPNVRLNFLPDVGDCISLSDIQLDGEWCKQYFSYLHLEYKDKSSNYILANFMAEYLYVLLLIAGYRAYQLSLKNPNSTTIWQTTAKQVFENSVTMVNTLTYKSENEIRTTLSKACDQTKLARQMQFWMSKEYINHIKNNEVPSDVYGEDVKVDVDISRFRRGTFNEEIGYSINGKDADLGTVNGQEPIKEANKLLYWTVTLIVSSAIEFNFIIKDILNIFAVSDFQECEKRRLQAFDYIATPYREKIQTAICNRLTEKAETPEQASYYEEAAKNHQRLYAARVTQGFWRRKLERIKQNCSSSNVVAAKI